ncbi:hypothetical protein ACRE_060970 [Hapsidospora chrysogenum ATCC 11550]|uniref:Uncharacterized protein n=1 Tax=Hapsidospora chrysogenum (strain ATCC 11550 / CBS 779.69 / DSM 880 / IAM 14645 / JCM 23072 / IMI 49137) TaxID=857340 RepID=A0A086T1A5_HAPC1|nr:hypothetical protein ACRE_060970 [Hapsidospora chrysogenum ATCC 11550]
MKPGAGLALPTVRIRKVGVGTPRSGWLDLMADWMASAIFGNFGGPTVKDTNLDLGSVLSAEEGGS